MVSINQEIARLLNKHISIQKSLKREIINLRALAKFLIKQYNLNHPVDAVISAIRRYEGGFFADERFNQTNEAFNSMLITTKDNVARLVVKDNEFSKICEDYLDEQKLKKNFRLVKSKEELTLIVNQKDLKEKLVLFDKENILCMQENLSEIRLQFPIETALLKGLLSRLAAEITTRDINMMDIISSKTEILLYVEEKDLINSIDALRKIKD